MFKMIFLFLFSIGFIFPQENYVIIKNKTVKAYGDKFDNNSVVTNFNSGKRLSLVEYDNDFAKIFYREKDGLDYVAYIKRNEVFVREVNREKALTKIKELNDFVMRKTIEKKELVVTQTYTYIQGTEGHKNIADSEGERASSASIFYKEPNLKAKWVYLGDRSLIAIEGEEKDYIKVSTPGREEFLYIRKKDFKFTRGTKIPEIIQKVIFVDRINQNTQLYDYVDGQFVLTHSSISTTGYNDNKNSYKTPKGYYIVSNIKPFMLYYEYPKSGNEERKLGRALYAVRFSGGYYLHGIPLKDELRGEERERTRRRVASILGSHPSSSGCVRNSDADAKFIYEWTNSYEIRKDYFVPRETIAVIVSD